MGVTHRLVLGICSIIIQMPKHSKKMLRCVCACKTNYDSKKCSATSRCEKVPVYSLPSDEEDKNKWIQAAPNADLTISSNTVICELH